MMINITYEGFNYLGKIQMKSSLPSAREGVDLIVLGELRELGPTTPEELVYFLNRIYSRGGLEKCAQKTI